MSSNLPTPSQLLGAGNFQSWYPGQYDLLTESLNWYYSPVRFLGMAVPTGHGKSLDALLLSRLSETRTIVLTATKGLQDQYMRDAQALGGVVIKGQNNFPCILVSGLNADEGPCHDGLPCELRKQCPYRIQLERAMGSKLVITNYAYWLAQNNFSSGLGDVGLLVCDEAHQAFGAMESYLTIFLSRLELQPLGITFPSVADKWGAWQSWAKVSAPLAKEFAAHLDSDVKRYRNQNKSVPNHISRSYRSAKATAAKLERLSTVSEQWVIQRTYHGYRFVPKWVANYASHLFLEIPKVVLMSAILSHRSADYLGVPSDGSRAWIEADSHFPAENTPIWHIPTARINYRTDDYGETIWVSRVDQIIQRRLDRKGIVFTVSYERAKLLMARSRFKGIMVSHGTSDVVDVVDRFKKMDAPAVLLSPSVTTGYDFPAELYNIRYIIVGKLPYPDTTDVVVQARQEEDKSWTSYVAMETLVQECGRATRCLSWGTQVLTATGWKGPEEIAVGDQVYSLSGHNFDAGKCRVGGLELNPVREIHVWDTDKEMVHVTGKSLDVLVTTDHNMVVLPYNAPRSLVYKYRDSGGARRLSATVNLGIKAGLSLCTAAELPVRSKILVSGHCQRERRGSLVCRMLERDSWYFLMGIIISDGWMSSSKGRIRIFQSTAKIDVCDQIDNAFVVTGLRVTRGVRATRGTTMTCSGRSYMRSGDMKYWDISGYAADRVRRFFAGVSQVRQPSTRDYAVHYLKGVEKTIPLWVLQQCRKRELRALLTGLMAGDGTWSRSAVGGGTYFTSDKVLADRLQYLLVLADYRSRLRERGGQYEVQFSDNQFVEVTQENVSVEPYTGKTWCVTTDLGTIVTRRNGCAAIVGNSATDRVEVLLIDDNAKWFMYRYRDFAPKWFMERWRGSLESVPDPLV